MSEIKLPDEGLKKKLLRRQNELETIRLPWESPWQEIADFVIQQRYDIKGTQQKGKKTGELIFDGTPGMALQLLADGLHGYLVSPSMQWFRLKMADHYIQDVPEVKVWLGEVEEALYGAFNQSNFYDSMSQYFLDGGSIGTATMYIEENIKDRKIAFSTRHINECFIAEDIYGKVDTVFRKFNMTARQALQKFDQKNLSRKLLQSITNNKADDKHEFLHCVFPRSDRNIRMKNTKNKRYASVYIQTETGHDEENKILEEGGYDNLPYVVWRWRKNTDEIYGRSPASDALYDILMLNRMAKTMIAAGQVAVEPPMNIPAKMRGNVRFGPRGMNYFEDKNEVPFPVNMAGNYPIGIDREDKKRDAVKEHFKVDFFLMLANLQRQATATEIIERQGEKAAILGSTLGRLNNECQNPTIDIVFDIELKARRLPEIPQILMDYVSNNGNGKISVDYLGPLAQAQKRLFRSQGVMRSLEALGPVAQMRPEVLDNFDFDVISREIAESFGMPQKAIKNMQDVMKARQERQEMMQQEMEKEDMMRAAEGVKTVAQAEQAATNN